MTRKTKTGIASYMAQMTKADKRAAALFVNSLSPQTAGRMQKSLLDKAGATDQPRPAVTTRDGLALLGFMLSEKQMKGIQNASDQEWENGLRRVGPLLTAKERNRLPTPAKSLLPQTPPVNLPAILSSIQRRRSRGKDGIRHAWMSQTWYLVVEAETELMTISEDGDKIHVDTSSRGGKRTTILASDPDDFPKRLYALLRRRYRAKFDE